MSLRLALCIPSSGLMRAECALSCIRFVTHLASRPLLPEGGEQSIQTYMRLGSGIAANRDYLADLALENGATHVLFVDDDMVFEPEAVVHLISRRLPIVATTYRKRFPPAEFIGIYQDPQRVARIGPTEKTTGVIPAKYSGFGLSLIAREVFEKLPKPRFLNEWRDGTYTSEDLPFYDAARAAGYPCWIDLDASKLIGHIGQYEYRWDQPWPDDAENPQGG